MLLSLRKNGLTKGGVYKRRQTQISDSLKWVPKRTQTRAIASKLRQMRTNVKSKNFTPFYAPRFAAAQFARETSEKCRDILVIFSRPSVSRENGCKIFYQESASTHSTVHHMKFFHCYNSGSWGANRTRQFIELFFVLLRHSRKLAFEESFCNMLDPLVGGSNQIL